MSIKLKDTIYDLVNNADKIDNLDSTSLFRKLGSNVDINTFADNSNKNGIIYINTTTPANINAPFSYGTILSFNSDAGSWMLGNSSSGVLKFRNRWWSGNGATWSDWKDIAFKTDIPTIPTALKNPQALTIQNNGTTVGTYDGSAAKTFNITHPTIPTSLKCPTSLTIQFNGTSQGAWDGSTAKTINITPAAIGAAASDHTHSGYLPRLRMTNPDPGHASIGSIPYIFALKAAGTPVYGDPEFKDGTNNVSYYNNSGGGTVTVTRISDNQNSANSSGKILQISTTTGTASPGRGGFVQHITSRAGAVFCQIFRAKIPTGFTVENAENNMGDGYRTYWLTDRTGTGKWEWYCRITICGLSGNMHGGGHVYLSGSGAVTWYLSYCNLIDLTKGNYDGLRSVYAEKLDSSAGSATNPIYFSGGKPVACTYSLNKTVPSDAKFTDTNTTYSAGTGLSLSGTTFNHASSVTAGTAGTSSATSGSTLAVPYVTVNATGHVTGYGTHTHTVSGFAASSHSHSSLTCNYNGGVKSNPQEYFSNTIGLKVAMTGHWSQWSDTLWINGYSGGDVKSMCALHFLRNGTPRMGISTQQNTATSYGTIYEVITGYNIANQSVNYANSAGSVAWGNVTGKPSTFAPSSHNHSYLRGGPDNRSTNNSPSWYMTNLGAASIYTEFCQSGGANGNYENRTTFIPWGDQSGQRPVQLAFNNSGMFIRTAASDTAWNGWSGFSLAGHTHSYVPNNTGSTITGHGSYLIIGQTGGWSSGTSAARKLRLGLGTVGHTGSQYWTFCVDDTTTNSYLQIGYDTSTTALSIRHDGLVNVTSLAIGGEQITFTT